VTAIATAEAGTGAATVDPGAALVATQLPGNQPDWAYNGALLGRNGTAYEAGTPLSNVAPVVPAQGAHRAISEDVLFVGGITRSRANVSSLMQTIANDTGAGVTGIHNATSALDPSGISGAPLDVIESSDHGNPLANHVFQNLWADLTPQQREAVAH
jgi:hypothetical protein